MFVRFLPVSHKSVFVLEETAFCWALRTHCANVWYTWLEQSCSRTSTWFEKGRRDAI